MAVFLSEDSLKALKELGLEDVLKTKPRRNSEESCSSSSTMSSSEGQCALFGTDDSDEDEIVLKYDTYERKCWKKFSKENSDGLSILSLALISSHHSLWGEFIYNAARVLSDRIDSEEIDVIGKKCLELGAGCGLPSVIAALHNASEVVISDYGVAGDESLIAAIKANIEIITPYIDTSKTKLAGVPFVWGYPVDPLVQACGTTAKFDRIFLADLLFNRSEHKKLLHSVSHALAEDGIAYVTFSHHDPHKTELDLNFFELARLSEFNLESNFVLMEQRSSYPFVENDGRDIDRGKVYMYTLQHKKQSC